jgi:deazaflavin-dependent oxidoreductase (nitroreductase family)
METPLVSTRFNHANLSTAWRSSAFKGASRWLYGEPMIIAIVRFGVNTPTTYAQSVTAFSNSAANYVDVPGLIRKDFLRSEDGDTAGGVYLWESRAQAEAMYDDGWRTKITAKYGAEPTVEYFDVPVTVDKGSVVAHPASVRDSALGWVAEHTKRYVETGGADGHMWQGVPTLILTTTGRRSGEPRRNALIYGQDNGDYIVVASYGGRPNNPLWYDNLVADSTVTIQVIDQVMTATATTVTDTADRDALWTQLAALFPNYTDYQAKTERQIPIVRLTPQR